MAKLVASVGLVLVLVASGCGGSDGKTAALVAGQLPATLTEGWRKQEFRREHPEGRVLSRETGHVRDYGSNPYSGYDDAASPPFFPAANADDRRLPAKERVVFFRAGKRFADSRSGGMGAPFPPLRLL